MKRSAVLKVDFALPREVKALFSVLRRAGIEVCAVGGCVRDLMRGAAPHDWDAAAAAPPERLRELLETSGYRVIPTGIKHGTLTVLCPRGDIMNERMPRDRANADTDTAAICTTAAGTADTDTVATITTTAADTSVAYTAAADADRAYIRVELTSYRRESGYSDRRHPDSVEYTDSLDEDLARRDFTINAMAYLDGVGVYDPYSGRADLESRTIRAVGEPERRFGEDALRILRGLRFAARFGFIIEPETLAAMRSCRELLYDISVERLRDELLGLLRGAGAERLLCARYDILSIVLPELDETAYSAGAKLVGALNREYPVDTVSDAARFAALISSLPAADAENCARRLRFDKRAVRRIRDILLHIRREYTDRVSIKRLLSEVGADVAVDVLRLAALGGTASTETLSWLEKIIENGECISLSRLKINGDILLRLGAKPRDCGRLLARIFDEVLCDRLENDPERLISYAERLINAEKSTCDN